MLNELWRAYRNGGGRLLKEWPWSFLTLAAYGLLFLEAYLFLRVREGTLFQLFLSATLLAISCGWFLFLQGWSLSFTHGEENWRGRLFSAGCSLGRLSLVTLPALALLLICLALILWVQASWPVLSDAGAATVRAGSGLTQGTPSAATSVPPAWPGWLWGGGKLLALGFLLPLFALHSWILAWPKHPPSFFKRIRMAFAGTFSLRGLLAYVGGFLLFAVLPWAFMVFHHHWTNPWIELLSLGLRLLLAFTFLVLGWHLTLAVQSEVSRKRAS